jgi:hypothetical protein
MGTIGIGNQYDFIFVIGMPLRRSGKCDVRSAQSFSIFGALIGLNLKFFGFLGVSGVWHARLSFRVEYWNAGFERLSEKVS